MVFLNVREYFSLLRGLSSNVVSKYAVNRKANIIKMKNPMTKTELLIHHLLASDCSYFMEYDTIVFDQKNECFSLSVNLLNLGILGG